MKNKLLNLIVGIVITSALVMVPSFADASCSTCSTTPTDLKTYFDVMDQLIKILEQSPGKKAGSGGETPSTELTEGETDPRASVIQAAEKIKAKQEVSQELIQTILKPHFSGGTFGEIAVLKSGKARERDWEKLLKIDEKIAKATQKIESGKYLTIRVPESVLNQVDQILIQTKYMRLMKSGSTYNMKQGGAEYRDFVKLLWNLNGLYKELHLQSWYHQQLYDATNENQIANLEDPKDAVEHPVKVRLGLAYQHLLKTIDYYLLPLTDGKKGSSFDRIEFDDDKKKFLAYIWQIQQDYECAYGVKNGCDAEWLKTVDKSRQNVKDVYNIDGKFAINTFKDAFSRLKGALFIGDSEDKEAAQQRKNQLLHGIYGRDIPSYQKWWNQSETELEENVSKTKKTLTTIKKALVRATNNRFFKIEGYLPSSDTIEFIESGVEVTKNIAKNFKNDADLLQNVEQKVTKLVGDFGDYFDKMNDYRWGADSTDSRSILNQASLDAEIRSFQTTFKSMQAYQRSLNTHAVMVSPHEFTKQFPALSNAVYTNIKEIGTQNQNDAGLYYYMGSVCKEQCADSLQGKCRYHGS